MWLCIFTAKIFLTVAMMEIFLAVEAMMAEILILLAVATMMENFLATMMRENFLALVPMMADPDASLAASHWQLASGRVGEGPASQRTILRRGTRHTILGERHAPHVPVFIWGRGRSTYSSILRGRGNHIFQCS